MGRHILSFSSCLSFLSGNYMLPPVHRYKSDRIQNLLVVFFFLAGFMAWTKLYYEFCSLIKDLICTSWDYFQAWLQDVYVAWEMVYQCPTLVAHLMWGKSDKRRILIESLIQAPVENKRWNNEWTFEAAWCCVTPLVPLAQNCVFWTTVDCRDGLDSNFSQLC